MYFKSLTDAQKKEILVPPLKVLRKNCILNGLNWKEKKKIECLNENRQRSKDDILA